MAAREDVRSDEIRRGFAVLFVSLIRDGDNLNRTRAVWFQTVSNGFEKGWQMFMPNRLEHFDRDDFIDTFTSSDSLEF